MKGNLVKGNFNQVRAFMIVHLVLVLLIPFLLTQMGGCQEEKDTLPLNLGAEVTPESIDEALAEPLKSTTPVSMKLGEGFVVSETQELGAIGGGAKVITADTSQTVVERTENDTEILLTIIEHRQTYNNGDVQKTSTEIPLRIEKSAAAPSANSLMVGPGKSLLKADFDATAASSKAIFRGEVDRVINDKSPLSVLALIRANSVQSNNLSALASATKVTYHGLKVTNSLESPPLLVQRRENCAGIPNCLIRVFRVEFDMVFWEAGRPDRVHWEFAMSPEAPFLAGVLDKCVTGMAKLGNNQGEILVRQCMPVIDFRYTN